MTRVTRPLVEAALLRLVRYPGTTSVRNVMRVVDEYAASQHTELVYKHAEKIIGEALIQAAYAKESGKKIFVEARVEGGVSPEYVKNFFSECDEVHKKFFIDLLYGAESVSIMVAGASPTCTTSPVCTKCQECPECLHGAECPICRNTPVRDTSGKDTLATPDGGADTPVPDTRGTVTDATDTPDAVRSESDKGGLATDRPDTTDRVTVVRVPMDDAQLNRAPESCAPPVAPADRAPEVDKPTYESGKSDAEENAPHAPVVDAETIKECSRCGRPLPLSAYVLARGRRDGRASACRECEQQRHRDYRAAKREERQNGAQNGQKRPSEAP